MHYNLRNIKHGGFTLVELLIVMIIIGILSSMVLLSVGGATDGAGDESARWHDTGSSITVALPGHCFVHVRCRVVGPARGDLRSRLLLLA